MTVGENSFVPLLLSETSTSEFLISFGTCNESVNDDIQLELVVVAVMATPLLRCLSEVDISITWTAPDTVVEGIVILNPVEVLLVIIRGFTTPVSTLFVGSFSAEITLLEHCRLIGPCKVGGWVTIEESGVFCSAIPDKTSVWSVPIDSKGGTSVLDKLFLKLFVTEVLTSVSVAVGCCASWEFGWEMSSLKGTYVRKYTTMHYYVHMYVGMPAPIITS